MMMDTGEAKMFSAHRTRGLLSLAALAMAALLGGCIAYPAYPGYYGGGPYYGGGVVAFGGGWHDHHWQRWHDRY
jgi:hypothetical protein